MSVMRKSLIDSLPVKLMDRRATVKLLNQAGEESKQERRAKLDQLFAEFDTDESNTLDRNETQKLIAHLYPDQPAADTKLLDTIMKKKNEIDRKQLGSMLRKLGAYIVSTRLVPNPERMPRHQALSSFPHDSDSLASPAHGRKSERRSTSCLTSLMSTRMARWTARSCSS